jgi:hypothetical protein
VTPADRKTRDLILGVVDGSPYVDGKLKPAVRALQDHVAQLEAELTAERKAHERTKTLRDTANAGHDAGTRDMQRMYADLAAQLAAERAAHARTQAERDEWRARRDFQLQLSEKYQAEAAETRKVLRILHVPDTCILREYPNACLTCRVIAGNAGRAIAERVKRLEAVAKAAQDFMENAHYEKVGKLRRALDKLAALDEKGGAQ